MRTEPKLQILETVPSVEMHQMQIEQVTEKENEVLDTQVKQWIHFIISEYYF